MLVIEQIKQITHYLSSLYYNYFQDNEKVSKELGNGIRNEVDNLNTLSDTEFTNFLSEMDKLNLLRKEQENNDRKD